MNSVLVIIPAYNEQENIKRVVDKRSEIDMSIILRAALMMASLATFIVIVRKIRHAKVQIENSLFWIVFSAGLLVISIFPDIAGYASQLLGFQAPVNFIFLFVIFVLLIHQFFNSLKISQLENKIKELTQELAVRDLTKKEDEKSN